MFDYLKRLLGAKPAGANPAPAARPATPWYLGGLSAEEFLNGIGPGKELQKLPRIYWLLQNKAEPSRAAAVRVLRETLDSLPASSLLLVDAMCRGTSSEWSLDWRTAGPKSLIPDGADEPDRVAVLGFASFHSVGYVREKAVRLLAGIHSGGEIPYLLIRLNDWVEVVREAAKQAVEERLDPAQAPAFVGCLPLVERIAKRSRDDHSPLVCRIYLLVSGSRDALIEGLKSAVPPVRTASFKLAAQSLHFGTDELFGLIRRDRSGTVRSRAMRSAAHRIDSENVERILAPFLEDRSAMVRCDAVEIYCRFRPDKARGILVEQACSPMTYVRETAVFYLRKLGEQDIAGLYRSRLAQTTEPLPGAILGLGETGDLDDRKRILPFLTADSGRVARAAIRSLNLLQAPDFVPTVLPYLSDPRPGVSKEAHLALRKHAAELDAGCVLENLDPARPLHVRRNSFGLATAMRDWDSLPPILSCIADPSAPLAELARVALRRWVIRSRFTRPSPAQMLAIGSALQKAPLTPKMRNRVEFSLECWI